MPPDGAGADAVDLLALKVNRELLGAVVVVAGVSPNLKGSVGAADEPEPEPVKLNVAFFALLTPSSVDNTLCVMLYYRPENHIMGSLLLPAKETGWGLCFPARTCSH